MPSSQSDDTPFNPFYIGPHPSKACAIPEIPGKQCSPCQNTEDGPGSSGQGTVPTGNAGGMLIVGVSGPTSTIATIYSTSEALATAVAKAGAKAAAARAGVGAEPSTTAICKPYPCMEGARREQP
ncbi:hypothetical protein KR018_000690 [Drosophila ironensis]|nr:hypothetical protein KR018_000690 [Drosophila ironensis]